MNLYRAHVLVCGGTGCHSSNSDKIIERMEEKIKEKELDKEIKVIKTGCFGLCESGPNMVVYPEGIFYNHVKVSDVDEIVEEHFFKGRPVKRLLYKEVQEENNIKSVNDVNFYKKQTRVALRNCGVIDPENIEEYPITFKSEESATILGFPCKLAVIEIFSEDSSDESGKVEIWYTEKIPQIFWGNYQYLNQIPGAA